MTRTIERREDTARAERVRAELLRRIPKGARRAAALEIGVTNTALGDFLDGKTEAPLPKTLDLYEAWLRRHTKDLSEADGRTDYIRQIDEILARKWSAAETDRLIARLESYYRATAISESMVGLAAAIRIAEENAALLSRERSEHRQALRVLATESEPPLPTVSPGLMPASADDRARGRGAGSRASG